MEDREQGRERGPDRSAGAGEPAPGAGAANTPPFGRESETRGQSASATPKSNTERELERTRDMVAEAAAPVMAEKAQEAMKETGERLTSGPMGDQMKEQMGRAAIAARDDAGQMAREKVGEVRHRAENRINETLDRAASGLEDAARQLDQVADRQSARGTGSRAKAGRMAHSAADSMESVARYLRDNDAQSLERELESQVRTNPVPTLLVAVAAGWIVGKILR